MQEREKKGCRPNCFPFICRYIWCCVIPQTLSHFNPLNLLLHLQFQLKQTVPAGYKSALPRQHGTSGLKSAVTSYNYSKLDKSWGWYNLIVECQRKQPGPKGSQSIICKAQRGTKPSETVYIPAHWFIFVYDERSCDYHPHILLQLWNVQSQREQGYRFIYLSPNMVFAFFQPCNPS